MDIGDPGLEKERGDLGREPMTGLGLARLEIGFSPD